MFSGKIYTPGTNFTRPPVMTNLNSDVGMLLASAKNAFHLSSGAYLLIGDKKTFFITQIATKNVGNCKYLHGNTVLHFKLNKSFIKRVNRC